MKSYDEYEYEYEKPKGKPLTYFQRVAKRILLFFPFRISLIMLPVLIFVGHTISWQAHETPVIVKNSLFEMQEHNTLLNASKTGELQIVVNSDCPFQVQVEKETRYTSVTERVPPMMIIRLGSKNRVELAQFESTEFALKPGGAATIFYDVAHDLCTSYWSANSEEPLNIQTMITGNFTSEPARHGVILFTVLLVILGGFISIPVDLFITNRLKGKTETPDEE